MSMDHRPPIVVASLKDRRPDPEPDCNRHAGKRMVAGDRRVGTEMAAADMAVDK
ncbi:hypothetical protein D3C76_1018230 [compost metagenome]